VPPPYHPSWLHSVRLESLQPTRPPQSRHANCQHVRSVRERILRAVEAADRSRRRQRRLTQGWIYARALMPVRAFSRERATCLVVAGVLALRRGAVPRPCNLLWLPTRAPLSPVAGRLLLPPPAEHSQMAAGRVQVNRRRRRTGLEVGLDLEARGGVTH